MHVSTYIIPLWFPMYVIKNHKFKVFIFTINILVPLPKQLKAMYNEINTLKNSDDNNVNKTLKIIHIGTKS